VYRDAIEADASDATLFYNLGVLLEDMDRGNEAMEAYQGALQLDPDIADCHYNLALLYEKSGEDQGSDPPHGAVSQADRKKRDS
jgi:tetratricopeptide (TPR) repeat protein